MPHEFQHRIGVRATPAEVFRALTETPRLAGWWTADTRGRGAAAGDTLEFWFDGFCQTFTVKALEPGRAVRWKAGKTGALEWAGTEIAFTLSREDGQTRVRFRHSGWRAKTDFFAHCCTKWAVFLLSLKAFLETGEGRPAPHDVGIDHG